MRLVYANLQISNPTNQSINSINTRFLVDTGAVHLCIPEHLALQLDLKELETREVFLADGKRIKCSYSGPVMIEFENRKCFTGALILGNDPLLGAIPLEDMDLVIHPSKLALTVNPDNPNIALTYAM